MMATNIPPPGRDIKLKNVSTIVGTAKMPKTLLNPLGGGKYVPY